MNINKGNSLSQYIIIIALIAIPLISIFFVYGQSIVAQFNNLYVSLNTSNSSSIPDNNTTPTAGSLGGTPTNPVRSCKGGVCSIDYGDLILNGIPENFQEFVKSNGTSGGTDATCAIFNQIADELKKKGDSQGYEDFKALASLGHIQAQYQKYLEGTATACQGNSNPANCMFSNLAMFSREDLNLNIPSNLSTILSNYKKDYDIGSNADSFNNEFTNLGYARNISHYYTNLPDFAKSDPSYATMLKLDTILSNSKYSDNLKNITLALLQNNQNIASNQEALTDSFLHTNNNFSALETYKYDILTGQVLSNTVPGPPPSLDVFLHPQASIGMDLNSALICVAGKNQSKGRSCY